MLSYSSANIINFVINCFLSFYSSIISPWKLSFIINLYWKMLLKASLKSLCQITIFHLVTDFLIKLQKYIYRRQIISSSLCSHLSIDLLSLFFIIFFTIFSSMEIRLSNLIQFSLRIFLWTETLFPTICATKDILYFNWITYCSASFSYFSPFETPRWVPSGPCNLLQLMLLICSS